MRFDKFEAKYGEVARNQAGYSNRAEQYKELYEQGKAAFDVYAGGDAVETVPFNDDLTKAEMIDHLVNVHGLKEVASKAISTYSGTKATKSEMIRAHGVLHARQDDPGAEFDYSGWSGYRENGVVQYTFTLAERPIPLVRHRHGVTALSDDQKTALAAVRNNQRASGQVLSDKDRKVLKELVDNDFGGLKQEMRAFAADTLFVKKSEIESEWDAKEASIPDFAKQATDEYRDYSDKKRVLRAKHDAEMKALEDKHDDKHKTIVAKAKGKGVVLESGTETEYNPLTGRNDQRTVFTATVEGRKEALTAAERENKSFLDRALMTLEKQRLDAQRQVLLSGVPDAAMPILDGIPNAKSMMVSAQNTTAAITSKTP